MNYRRGLLRLYAVLALTWFAVVVFMVFSDRWIWQPWKVIPITFSQLARPDGTIELPIGMTITKESAVTALPSAKLLWSAALGVPIPLVLYCLLFYVVPWVYRGFKASTTI